MTTIKMSFRMTEENSIANARRNVPRRAGEAVSDKTVELTRRGFAAAYRDFLGTVDLSELALDPDDLFMDVRDRTPGRIQHRLVRHG